MLRVSDVYTQVCDVLLEPLPTGLSLGVITPQQFLDLFSDTYQDFAQHSGLVKKLLPIVVSNGRHQYSEPGNAMIVQEAFYNERYIGREEAMDMDFLERLWRLDSGPPRVWHEDRLGIKSIEVNPTPTVDGMYVAATTPMLGTLGAVTGANDFDIQMAAPLYGTISSYTGPMYLETAQAFYGVIGDIVSSTGNITLLATVKQPSTVFQLTDIIQFIPDSFVLYLKYGVLAKIFATDGEAKDEGRQKYAAARFSEGALLAKAVMQEVDSES